MCLIDVAKYKNKKFKKKLKVSVKQSIYLKYFFITNQTIDKMISLYNLKN